MNNFFSCSVEMDDDNYYVVWITLGERRYKIGERWKDDEEAMEFADEFLAEMARAATNEEEALIPVAPPRAPMATIETNDAKVYLYPDGTTFRVENVVKFGAPGTTHRLESRDGRKWIIAPGWIAVELIGVERWSV